MDVRMPDGTIVKNVPEGITKAEVMAKYSGRQSVNVPEGPVQPPPVQGLMDHPLSGGPPQVDLGSFFEPAMTVGSGMAAEPLAGLAGIAQSLNPFANEGAGAKAVGDVRQALTYIPKTPAGRAGLEKLGQMMSPVANMFKGAEDYLGNKGNEIGGPVVGALATAIPTAALMAAGPVLNKLKSIPKPNVNKLLTATAPSVDDLKTAARGIYNELDNSGAVVNSRRISGLGQDLAKMAKREGVNNTLHPKSSAALNEIIKSEGNLTLTEVDTLRKIAKAAAESIDPSDARLGSMMVDKIDDFLDKLKPADFSSGGKIQAGTKFKEARALWQRAKKSEMLDDAFKKAGLQASGFENGIRVQFRSILNNKKKMRGFTPEERTLMEQVVKGGTAENLAKRLGKFGFGEGQATSMLMSSLGVAGGAAVGGPAGAVAVPLIGTMSRNLAQKLTRNNASFANAVVRAGKDGNKIVQAYIKSVPAKERSVAELTELLLRPGTSLKRIAISNPTPVQKLSADAIYFADFIRSQEQQQENK